MITGSTDLGNGVLAVTVDHDPTAVATDVPLGTLIIDASATYWRKLDNGSTTNVAQVAGLNQTQIDPRAEDRVGGNNNSRVAQTTFDGSSYLLRGPSLMNRFAFRISGQSGAPTGRFLFYQNPDGGFSTAVPLVASITSLAIGGTGNFEVPFDGAADVYFKEGLLWILFGRDSGAGSFTVQTYAAPAQLQLLVQNVPAAYYPLRFSTVIAATTSPATFDPTAGTGGSPDTTMICRMRKV